jgi:hypothetical protein
MTPWERMHRANCNSSDRFVCPDEAEPDEVPVDPPLLAVLDVVVLLTVARVGLREPPPHAATRAPLTSAVAASTQATSNGRGHASLAFCPPVPFYATDRYKAVTGPDGQHAHHPGRDEPEPEPRSNGPGWLVGRAGAAPRQRLSCQPEVFTVLGV